MAVLETIRVKFGVLITVLIAIALLSFIVDPSVFNSCTGGNGDVAEIEGNDITYMDYQSELEKARISFDANQMMRGRVSNAELQGYVWEKYLDQYGFFNKYAKAGISVSDYELATVLQYDQNYNYLVSVKEQRPDAGILIDNYVYQLRKNLYTGKYMSLFQQSAMSNPLAVANVMGEKSDKTEYIALPLGSTDQETEVSEEEIKAWYDAHKEEFRLPARLHNQREIEFATFDVTPSAADIAVARERAEEQLAELQAKPLADFNETSYYMNNELSSEPSAVNDFIFNKDGRTSELIDAGDSLYAVRILDSKMLPDSVEFLLAPAAGDKTADSLFNGAQTLKMSFNELDSNFADPYELISQANDKAFVTTARDQNKYLVKIVSKKAASLHKRISFVKEVAYVSEETDGNVYNKASEFSGKVGNYETFSAELAAIGQKDALHTAMITSDMYDIPYTFNMGMVNIRSARELVKWAFEAEEGNVSDILKLENLYVVAALKDINETEYVAFEQVKSSIESRIRAEKQLNAMAEDVKGKIAGIENMEEIAAKLDSKVNTENIIFSYTGIDSKLVGAVSASEIGKVYGPIVGANAVYVYKVVAREDRNPIPEEEVKGAKFNQGYQNYLMGNIYDAIYGSFDIDDDRIKFM